MIFFFICSNGLRCIVISNSYELSVCQNVHHNDSQCLDPNGEPIVAYACQVLESGIGLSLGSRIGYYDYNGTDGQRGITLEYTGGHFGCKVCVFFLFCSMKF